MSQGPDIRFAAIRDHEGSQQRAWEELCFLLATDLDDLPHDTVFARHGTPDGGIEFQCAAPPGHTSGTWAWQAKFLFEFKNTTFQQMGESFKEALRSRPDLVRYIFVLPKDLPAGARGKSAKQKWAEHVERWRDHALEQGSSVEFTFHGHSDVLRALTLDRHAGVARYFFDADLFTNDFFEQRLERAVLDLGHRYEPNLNVQTNVPHQLGGLCLEEAFRRDVAKSVGESVRRAETVVRKILELTGDPSSASAPLQELKAVKDVSDGQLAVGHADALHHLTESLTQCEAGLKADRASLGLVEPETVMKEASDGGQAVTVKTVLSWVKDALESVRGALMVTDGRRAAAALKQVMVVVGPAGCGKSHSLADASKSRLAQGSPTLLVLGQQLTVGTSISAQVLAALESDASWEGFLASLQVAAQLRGAGRALIAIDAINEGAGADLWQARIAGFISSIARYPMISMVLTVRDSYLRVVLPSDLDDTQYALAHHPGLSGRETEALQLYAEHYDLSVPDAPALHPEFSNPLLLRSICRAARRRGLSSIPGIAVGQAWIFDGLLSDVNTQISRTDALDREESDEVAQRASQLLASALLAAGSETLPVSEARNVLNQVHDDGGRASRSLLRALEREGILLREPPMKDGGSERVKFTYQRMSDYMRADSLVKQHPTIESFSARLELILTKRLWSSAGLIESLSAVVPEAFGAELIDCIGFDVPDDNFAWLFAEGLVNSLGWRRGETVTDRTVELIQGFVDDETLDDTEWLAVLISLACVPNHPLNADYLHGRLLALDLAERDTIWTLALQYLWQEDSNPLARTIDWLWNPGIQLTDEARRLAASLMSWLLASSSRRLRDSATKILVLLTDGRPGMLLQLTRCLADVDDPYVRERLVATAAGHAMRLPAKEHLKEAERTALGELATVVVAVAHDEAHRPHLLIEYYASEFFAAAAERLEPEDLPSPAPERVVRWPLAAPPRTALAGRLGSDDSTYLSGSPVGYDFREYTLERGLCSDFIPPGQRERRQRRRRNASRRLKTALSRLAEVTSKTPEKILDELTVRTPARRRRDLPAQLRHGYTAGRRESALDRLRAQHPQLVARAMNAIADMNSHDPVRLEVDLVERWIVARVLELGWEPNGHGGPDRFPLGPVRSGEDKVERIGKKYSWIAYYELLAILVRECMVQRWSNDEPAPYRDPWQLAANVDIDPTVVLRGDRPGEDTASARLIERARVAERERSWWLDGFSHPISTGGSTDEDWLRSATDLPHPAQTLEALDPDGGRWVALEAHSQWQLDRSGGEREPHRREMWVRSQSYLVAAEHVSVLRGWSSGQNWMGLWMPTPPDYGLGWYRAYPERPVWSDWYDLSTSERREFEVPIKDECRPVESEMAHRSADWARVAYAPRARDFPRCPIALATYGRSSSGDVDMSAKELPGALLPSPLLLKLLDARRAPGYEASGPRRLGLGATETEYSWLSRDGSVVLFATGGRRGDDPTVLFARVSTLSAALEQHGLSWWTWILGEKISWQHGRPRPSRLDFYGAAGLLGGHLDPWSLESSFSAGPE